MVAASQALFGRGELAGLDAGDAGAPSLAELPQAEVDVAADGCAAASVDLLAADRAGASRRAARRAVAEGGAYLNNVRVDRRGRACSVPTTCWRASGWCCAGASATWPRSRRRAAASCECGPVRCPQRR